MDTWSKINIMPKITLAKLFFKGPTMRPNALVVKAFDGSRRTVIGEVELPIKIGPRMFQIAFQIMDINLYYKFLLGRPLIHVVGGIDLHIAPKDEVCCQQQTDSYIWRGIFVD